MIIISCIIYLIKAGAGTITGNEVNFQDESRKVMEKTARGVHWMNDQWEKAKGNATGNNQLLLGNDLKQLAPTEIIAKVKSNPEKYNLASAEGLFIEVAVYKMEKRQFDDAEKIVMQLSEGEARNFMLNEINDKRNQ